MSGMRLERGAHLVLAALLALSACERQATREAADGMARQAGETSAAAQAAGATVAPTDVVDAPPGTPVSIDSILLQRDLDGAGGPDRLVRESLHPPEPGDSTVVIPIEGRLALYLDSAASPARTPAWALAWDDMAESSLERVVDVPGGGSLVLIRIEWADSDENVIVLARSGTARELLRQSSGDPDGRFALSESDGRVVIETTGQVELGDRVVRPSIDCARREIAGTRLVFGETTRGFVVEGGVCMPREEAR
jgi:hypothetical protein